MFVDFLAFQQVTLLFAAVMVAYLGIAAFFELNANDRDGLRRVLRSGAIPIGSLGAVSTTLALWAEVAWPLPGSYNILFTDVYLLFGVTLVVLAVSLATSSKLQFAGLFAMVAGGTAIAYGWAGYGLGMTKDPLETFLLYGAFGLSGILAFPATLALDYFMEHPTPTPVATPVASPEVVVPPAVARRSMSFQAASRAAQPVVPGTSANASTAPASPPFQVPAYIHGTLWAFVSVMALAALAALLYLNTTLPAHLTSAP